MLAEASDRPVEHPAEADTGLDATPDAGPHVGDADPCLDAAFLAAFEAAASECFGGRADGEAAERLGTSDTAVGSALEALYEGVAASMLEGGAADSVAALHSGLRACNDHLVQVEESLKEFHGRLCHACHDIVALRSAARGARAARTEKRFTQAHLTAFLGAITVPPEVVHAILAVPIGGVEDLPASFFAALSRLHAVMRSLAARKELLVVPPAHPSAAPTAPAEEAQHSRNAKKDALVVRLMRTKAFREVVGATEDVVIAACLRLRAVLAVRISALENPRCNTVAQQEHSLRQHRRLVRFMQDAVELLRATMGARTATMAAAGALQPPRPYAAASTVRAPSRPFVPFRLAKALYEDLKTQYVTTMHRVYTPRIARYLQSLTELELGSQQAAALAVQQQQQQSAAGSGSWGLGSLLGGWGSAAASPPRAQSQGRAAMPTAADHSAALRQRLRPPLLGEGLVAANGHYIGQLAEAAHDDAAAFGLGLREHIFIAAADELSTEGEGSMEGGRGGMGTASEGPGQTGSSASTSSQRWALLGDDPDLNLSVLRVPTIPHVQRLRGRCHAYEETLRSVCHLLTDAVTHEYLFLLDFFGADSWAICADIFGKIEQKVVDHVSDAMLMNRPREQTSAASAGASLSYPQSHHPAHAAVPDACEPHSSSLSPFVSANKDLCGILALLRVVVVFRTAMRHVRRLNVMDRFFHSLAALLFPAAHAAIEAHTRSVRALAATALSATHPPPAAAPLAATAAAYVPPIARRYAEVSVALGLLLDYAFVPHYRRLAAQDTHRPDDDGKHTPSTAVSSGAAAADPVLAGDADDEEELELGSWLQVLRANASVLRIEVLRCLRVGAKAKRPATAAALAAMPDTGYAARSAEERACIAGVGPLVAGLEHIVAAWEGRFGAAEDGPTRHPDEALRRSLRCALPTGLRREWTRVNRPAPPSATPTTQATQAAAHVSDQTPTSSETTAAARPPAPSALCGTVHTTGDMAEVLAAEAAAHRDFARVVVALAAPPLRTLPLLRFAAFTDSSDDDDGEVIADATDPRRDGAHTLDAAEALLWITEGELEATLTANNSQPTTEERAAVGDGPAVPDAVALGRRIAAAVATIGAVLRRAAAFAATWRGAVQRLAELVDTYVPPSARRPAALRAACHRLVSANGQLQVHVAAAVHASAALHRWRQQLLAPSSFPATASPTLTDVKRLAGSVAMPPAVSSVRGLVVPTLELSTALRAAVPDMDTRPDDESADAHAVL